MRSRITGDGIGKSICRVKKTLARTDLGRRFLEHAADRSSQRLLKLRFGTAPAEIGPLPT
jgi:hypothetical protein